VKHRDFIMVVVEKLTKAVHFIPIYFAEIYRKEVVRLHGVPKVTVLDRYHPESNRED
jgi:hypothetical protein